MGKKKDFLFTSMDTDRAKHIADSVGNRTARRILEHLSEHESATESDVARALSLAASTVHYNLKKLVENGLVKADEFHYSEKGREVNHYRLAHKYIIITPKRTTKKEVFKNLGISFAVSAIIAITLFLFNQPAEKVSKTEDAGAMVMERTADAAPQQAVYESASQTAQEPSIAFWFMIGAAVGLAAYFLISTLRKD